MSLQGMNYRTIKRISIACTLFGASFTPLTFSALAFAENGGLTKRDILKSELRALEEKTRPLTETFRKVVELIGPSVVSINTEKDKTLAEKYKEDPSQGEEEFGPPSPHQHPPEGRSNPHPGFDFPLWGQGSGLIIDTKGHVLTNYHVVEGFEEGTITVVTHDGRECEAKVVGLDSKTDIGILKIDNENLQPVEFGSSDDVHAGDWVIAIGNPFGYQQTVSAGIVSAVGRKGVIPFSRPFSYEDFIQTDAAINPGNSGGPLVNLRGEIIGINSAIATRTGGFQGVGFAISIEIANEVISDLIEKGRVLRGYLGVGIQDISDNLASYLNLNSKSDVMKRFQLDSDKGAFISEVWEDTPASKGEIFPGDVIIEFGGRKVLNADDLQKAIRVSTVDSEVKVKVIRDKKEKLLTIKIDQQPEGMSVKKYVTVKAFLGQASLSIGLVIEDLPLEKAEEHGVLVRHVVSDSPAERAEILPGDIILKVGSSEVNSANEFQSVLNGFVEKGMSVSVFVKSKGYVTLKY